MIIMTKKFLDPIHGYIDFKDDCLKIINHPIFKRLKNIKQLGFCHQVFIGANHTRFEHSLGVAHLCERFIINLKNNQPELEITQREVDLLKMAGLCHDLGHGPFSHVFDDLIVKKMNLGIPKHEIRSGILLEKIIKTTDISVTKIELDFIKNLIEPDKEYLDSHPRAFLFQILSNPYNGIDVDKFDYLQRDTYYLGLDYSFKCDRIIQEARVIDNRICFPQKLSSYLLNMFYVRYNIFRDICNHPVVRSIEFMILDCLISAEPVLQLKNKVDKDFSLLTDEILYLIKWTDNTNLKQAKSILNRIENRDLYKYLGEIIVSYTKKSIWTTIFSELLEKDNSLLTDEVKINYTHNRNDTLSDIYFYNHNKPDIRFELSQKELGRIIPVLSANENIFRVYSKNESKINIEDIKKKIGK